MNRFVILNSNVITDKLSAGQQAAKFNETQSILRVNKNNEDSFKDYVKYSEEEILSLDKSVIQRSLIQDFDRSNRPFTRIAITEKGWSFLAHFVEAETSKLNSTYCANENGVKESQHYSKFYDSNGDELTTQGSIDSDCVKSVFIIKPGIDYEIVSGEVHHYVRPTTDIRMHSLIGIIDPNGNPIAMKAFVRNLNLRYKDTNKAIMTDGRAPKLLRVNLDGVPFEANQMMVIMYHEPGIKHKFMLELEYYRK